MFNYTLDTSMLPKVWLYWNNKNGTIYMNGANGKRQSEPEAWMYTGANRYSYRTDNKVAEGFYWHDQDKPYGWVKAGSNLIFMYAKYHEDIDRLEVAAVKYDTTRGEYKHEWSWAGRRFFIGRDKSCILEDGLSFSHANSYYSSPLICNGNYAYDVRRVFQILNRQHFNDYVVQEFKKFIGENYFSIGNGDTINITKTCHIQRWYETVQKEKSTGKAQKLVDKLIEMPLSNIDGFATIYPEIPDPAYAEYNYYNLKDIVYFEKINDDWSVLRYLTRFDDGSLNETKRIYIGNDGTTRITSHNQNGWVPAKQVLTSSWRHNRAYIVNKDEAIAQCPRIKYITSSMGEQREYNIIDYITTALRFPEIEQLCKFGLGKLAQHVALCSTPKAELKAYFGNYYNDKEKNLLRKVGLTKPQLDIYATHLYLEHDDYINHEYVHAFKELRKIFGDDLTYLDVNSFAKYLKACKDWRYFKSYRSGYIFDGIGLNAQKLFKNLVRLHNKNDRIFEIVRDAINSYEQLAIERRFDIDWYFDDVSDAVRVHDSLTELVRIQNEESRALYNMQEAERRKKEEEKRIKLDKERAKYEYEDEDFIIRLPKDATEIVTEGSQQHICIGSYVSRHSLGETNLFFLRKKSESDKPFYAIEVSNYNNVVQIHGFGNKWLGNNPEAIPTVIRWLRKNSIKCTDKILTCTATGYCSNNTYCEMPVVDGKKGV